MLTCTQFIHAAHRVWHQLPPGARVIRFTGNPAVIPGPASRASLGVYAATDLGDACGSVSGHQAWCQSASAPDGLARCQPESTIVWNWDRCDGLALKSQPEQA